MHGEMWFGDTPMMLGTGDHPGRPNPKRQSTGGTYCVVEDVDTLFDRAEKAGAIVVFGPEDTDFGTRRCRLQDPEGYEWSFGTYAPSRQQS